MDFDYDEEFRKTHQDMYDAEDALVRMGFPPDQWILVKKYILSAILSNQITIAKAFENTTLIDPDPKP